MGGLAGGGGGLPELYLPRLGLPSEPRPPRRAPGASKTVSKLPKPKVGAWGLRGKGWVLGCVSDCVFGRWEP